MNLSEQFHFPFSQLKFGLFFNTFFYKSTWYLVQLQLFKSITFFFLTFFSMFILFLWVCVADLLRKDNKNKSQALTKGHWTAGYLFPHQPRCQLIAADISPMLFKSKQSRCSAFFCFFTKRGQGLEMPSSLPAAERLNTRRNHLIITQLALMVLSSFQNTANISDFLCTEDKVKVFPTTLTCHEKSTNSN